MVRYDRIWELCKENGKKRSYLSKAMGHSERYLLDARKQNTNIKPDELAILAAELNTSPEYLTGETDSPEAKNQSATEIGSELVGVKRKIMDEISDFSPEELELALARLRKIKESRE